MRDDTDSEVLLARVEPMVVAVYIEEITGKLAPTSVKQHMAVLRMLFDWPAVGQVLRFNPANSVRGPKHVAHCTLGWWRPLYHNAHNATRICWAGTENMRWLMDWAYAS